MSTEPASAVDERVRKRSVVTVVGSLQILSWGSTFAKPRGRTPPSSPVSRSAYSWPGWCRHELGGRSPRVVAAQY